MNHAEISPSNLEALSRCPGRKAAIAALPPAQRDVSSASAEQGTRRHALMEWRIHHPTKPWPTTITGEEGKTYKITGDDVFAVQAVWPYIQNHEAYKNSDQEWNGYWVEDNVEIGQFCGLKPGVCKGWVDLILVTRDEIEILDHKFGRALVDPDCLQLKAYGIGAVYRLVDPSTLATRPEFYQRHRQVRTIKLTIAQPENKEEPIRSVSYPLVESLQTWMEEVGKVAKAALEENAPRIPGDKQCHFCPVAKVQACPERQAQVAKAMFEILPREESMAQSNPEPRPLASVETITDIAEVAMVQDPCRLSVEDLGRALDKAMLIEGWFKDVRKRALALLHEGTQIPGWKLIAGKRTREWTGEEEETTRGLMALGVRKADTHVQKLVTPAQAEKLMVGRKTPIPLGNDKKKMHLMEELFSWKEGKPVLAPESHEAPAINAPGEMFQPVATPQSETKLPDFLL